MPSSLLNADTSFPQFARETSDSEKIEKITSYLFMLLEQLRYSLANLDQDNFNETGLKEIGEVISQPIYVRLEGTEGSIHQLSVTAELLSSRIEDAEGNVSELVQTAKTLTSRIRDAEGNISALTQTAEAITSQIEDVEGNVSKLTQTVNGFQLSVENGEASSTIALTSNGVSISSQQISFSGMVTFASLGADGTTVIDGSRLQTGTISAISISGCSISGGTVEGSTFRSVFGGSYGGYGGEIQFCYLNPFWVAGGIRLDDQGTGTATENRYRVFFYTKQIYGISFAMKLESAGAISIEASREVYVSGGTAFRADADTIALYGREIQLSGTVYINGKLYTDTSEAAEAASE